MTKNTHRDNLPRLNEPDRSLKISIIEGSFATVHITVSLGALVTGYALMLGANDFQLGLLAALNALSTIGSVISAQILGRLGSRKKLTVWGATVGRALWALLCVLPFIKIMPGFKLALFFAVMFLGNTILSAANTAWLSWMTDLVPPEKRGVYFGKRSAILGAVTMLTNYGAGWGFDRMKAAGLQDQGFALIFGLAALFAVIAGLILNRQWEPPLKGEKSLSIYEIVKLPFADPNFKKLLTFFICWSLSTAIAGPFFGAHMIKNLKMPYSVIALYSIVAGILNLSTQPLWGKIIDKLGNRPVLIFNLVGIFLLPLFWLFATPDFYLPIWVDAFLTGFFWPGFTLAGFNLLLLTAPEQNRTSYLSIYTVTTGFAVFLASLAGGWMANALHDFKFVLLGHTLINFHLLFAFSSLARIFTLPLALKLREERSHPVGTLLTLFGDKISQNLAGGWQAGIVMVKRITRG
ncbi:MAG: MFS transporter [Candidatus Latescibacteria bacterium]|nr:MFS transporter [Candidatus Latescibacterota bacterium]